MADFSFLSVNGSPVWTMYNLKVASVSRNGLMSKGDKSKLDGIAVGAQVNRAITDSVATTSSVIDASATAVKAAYDRAVSAETAAKAYADAGFLKDDANNIASGQLHIQYGDAVTGISSMVGLRIGVDGGGKSGTIRLDSNTAGSYGLIQASTNSLHLDSVGGNTYINYYDGNAIAIGNGAGAIAASFDTAGQLWHGATIGAGNKYWHAGNDGISSGLDADLVRGATINIGDATVIATDLRTIHQRGIIFAEAGVASTNQPVAGTTGAFLQFSDSAVEDVKFQIFAQNNNDLYMQIVWGNGNYMGWRKLWHNGNDGATSGLDADLLDALHATSFMRTDADTATTGKLTANRTGVSIAGTTIANASLMVGSTLGMDPDEIYFTTAGNIGTIGAFALNVKVNGYTSIFNTSGDFTAARHVYGSALIATDEIQVPAGSSLTDVTFTCGTDEDTGINFPSANVMDLVAGATKVASVKTTGIEVNGEVVTNQWSIKGNATTKTLDFKFLG